MKNVLLIALLFTSFIACKTDTSKQNQGGETNTSSPVTTDTKAAVKTDTMMHVHTYACPMHPEITSTKDGEKCSKCGMLLVHNDSK